MQDPAEYWDDRVLQLEMAVRTFRWRFRFALAGYIILAIGLVAAALLFVHQQNDIEAQAENLAGAAGAYCLAGLQTDENENAVIEHLANGDPVKLPKTCRMIVRRAMND